MRSPALIVVGAVVGVAGLVFTLQGVGVLEGSTMSNTTFWSVAGPVIMLAGVTLIGFGVRRRSD